MGWTKKISQAGCPVPIPPCSALLPLRLPRSELAACLRGPCLSDHSPSPTPPPLRAPPPPRPSPRVASALAPLHRTHPPSPVRGGRRCAGVTARGVRPALHYSSSQLVATSYRPALPPSQIQVPESGTVSAQDGNGGVGRGRREAGQGVAGAGVPDVPDPRHRPRPPHTLAAHGALRPRRQPGGPRRPRPRALIRRSPGPRHPHRARLQRRGGPDRSLAVPLRLSPALGY